MPELKVTGKRPLEGKITISGAKNAVLPQMAASLLTNEKVTLTNVPDITDVGDMKRVLEAYGVRVNWNRRKSTLELQAENPTQRLPGTNVGKAIRASFLVFGPLLARNREANVYRPGGCKIQKGGRKVDFHIEAMADMGAKKIREDSPETENGVISMKAVNGLKSKIITFKKSSVGATETVMMAASLVEGKTVIRHAAIEPEICDLAEMLRNMGAEIEIEEDVKIIEEITQFGITEEIEKWNVIRVEGQESLTEVTHKVMPDRIEFGTYAIAAAMNNGKIQLEVEDDMKESMLKAIRQPLLDAGVKIDEANSDIVEVSLKNNVITPVDVQTGPYPAFPTDLLPQWVTFMTQAQATDIKAHTIMRDTIFHDRFKFVKGLKEMKAKIDEIKEYQMESNEEIKKHRIHAGSALSGARVQATDLRGGAALVLAALVARGSTVVEQFENVNRGYEDMVGKLNACGAKLEISLPQSRPGHDGGPF
ncbi:uncharacterized protein LOC114519912 [Dendronephthya gigantea]|uniref:uncharacterized protein LOC114519912 n=1 Tax=Dendronephthya gigantea TaxID=151771 RepID=UPI00106D344E|nr:uncharacterized protein LOC114519912 [Dendronephthya gigantea]